jgi:hypothetical protein
MVAPEGDATGAELLHRINRRLKMIGSTIGKYAIVHISTGS